jgi:hypothetical protein
MNQPMMDGLRALIAETAQQLERVLNHDGLWCDPPAGSEAAADLSNTRTGPSGPWGEAPVRDAMDIVWMALGLAGESARACAALLGKSARFSRLPGIRLLPLAEPFAPRTSFPVEVLSRSVIEAASLAFWQTEGGLGVGARVARQIVYRMNGAVRMEEALDSMGGPRPGEQRRDYGELADDVRLAAADLGLPLTRSGRQWDCDGQIYPGYLDRAASLSASFSQTPKVPYQVYSGVAHAELWGLWRGYVQLPRNSHPHDRQQLTFTPLAVHSAVQALMGAITSAARQTAHYLGAAPVQAELARWASEADQRLDVLRP